MDKRCQATPGWCRTSFHLPSSFLFAPGSVSRTLHLITHVARVRHAVGFAPSRMSRLVSQMTRLSRTLEVAQQQSRLGAANYVSRPDLTQPVDGSWMGDCSSRAADRAVICSVKPSGCPAASHNAPPSHRADTPTVCTHQRCLPD